MYMISLRKTILAAAATLLLTPVTKAQETETYFPYPTVPESITGITPQADYMMAHFWDRCNLKQAFSSMRKMRTAFDDYVSLMPYASADTIRTSVNKLLTEVGKNPKHLLAMMEWAESDLYSDSARVVCDECYLPFVEAAARSKKLSKAERARYEYQAKVLGGSVVGRIAPDFEYTTPDGQTRRLSEIPDGPYILLFINDPGCEECAMARVRLSGCVDLNDLIDDGKIVVVNIYPGEYDSAWAAEVADYNPKWIVGASPAIDELYDMRNPPVFYYLNGSKQILSKSLQIDNLLQAFYVVNQRAKEAKANAANAKEAATEGTESESSPSAE